MVLFGKPGPEQILLRQLTEILSHACTTNANARTHTVSDRLVDVFGVLLDGRHSVAWLG